MFTHAAADPAHNFLVVLYHYSHVIMGRRKLESTDSLSDSTVTLFPALFIPNLLVFFEEHRTAILEYFSSLQSKSHELRDKKRKEEAQLRQLKKLETDIIINPE